MKKSKVHFWIKQLRRPICALVALSIVVFYCMTSYAAEEDTFSFKGKYFPNDTVQYMTTKAMFEQYGLEHDNSKMSVYRNVSYYFALNNVWQLLGTSMSNGNPVGQYNDFITWATSLSIPNSFTQNSIDYPLENTYIIMSSNNYYGMNYYCIIPQGYCCLVDGYVVSESPFIVYTSIRENNTNIYNVNQASSNGLYCFTPHLTGDSYTDMFFFTDLDMFFKTSDNGSGYSTFDLNSVGDFSISDAKSNYYNFNYLKTGGVIVAPSDPVPEPETIGQFYTYAGLDAYFSDGDATNIKLYYTVSPNEYMRLHPSEYDVIIDVNAIIIPSDTNHPNIPLTYTCSYMQGLEFSINGSSTPNLMVSFDELENTTQGNTLADALEGWWGSVTGSDTMYYNSNGSVISFGGATSGGSRSFGGYRLNPNLKIEDIRFQGSIRIEYNKSDPRQVSGSYRWQQGLISGSRTQLENNISNNYNPPATYDPTYPAAIQNSNGGGVVIGGTTVNPVVYNNLNAMVEYLFHVDLPTWLATTGTIHNNFQYVLDTVSDESDNGFFAVLEDTFDIIPEEIWGWIKASVAVILAGCAYNWVINGVRIKS